MHSFALVLFCALPSALSQHLIAHDTMEEWRKVLQVELPVDDGGYVRSFDVELEEEAAVQFFDEYGFVVFSNVLPEKIRAQAVDDIWNEIENSSLESIHRNDCCSWLRSDAAWTSVYGGGYNARCGFLGYDPALSQEAMDVRQHERTVRCFQVVWGREDLWCKFDRYGVMRPTKGIPVPGGDTTLCDRPEWKTKPFVHWDQNPFREPAFARVQGVVALSDHTATSGGFHCIPRFHHIFSDWANFRRSSHVQAKSSSALIELNEPELETFVKKITMRPGSLVIWDSRLAHGNWPNDDDQFRMVLYLTYFPSECASTKDAEHRGWLLEQLEKKVGVKLTPLGKKIINGHNSTQQMQSPTQDEHPVTIREPRLVNEDSCYSRSQWGLC